MTQKGNQKNIIIFVAVAAVLIMVLAFIFVKSSKQANQSPDQTQPVENIDQNQDQEGQNQMSTELDWSTDAEGMSKAIATVNTTKGTFKFRFFPEKAPQTSKRIAQLIQEGFYDGLTFHRVVPSFVVQGGDPTGTGAGGSGQNLPAEFNDIRHVRGSVAMARAQDPDSADSQFYVSLGTHPHLDHKYTVFGYVVEGMEVVEQISQGDKMETITVGVQ
jgi:cyclophilin family peptidyl-prolyl cis-trans isomerase